MIFCTTWALYNAHSSFLKISYHDPVVNRCLIPKTVDQIFLMVLPMPLGYWASCLDRDEGREWGGANMTACAQCFDVSGSCHIYGHYNASIVLNVIYGIWVCVCVLRSFYSRYCDLTYKACRMKTRHKGFWRPTNQNFVFWPFMFSLKNNKFWCVWGVERTSAHLITVSDH